VRKTRKVVSKSETKVVTLPLSGGGGGPENQQRRGFARFAKQSCHWAARCGRWRVRAKGVNPAMFFVTHIGLSRIDAFALLYDLRTVPQLR
jgi:hypothetical protein